MPFSSAPKGTWHLLREPQDPSGGTRGSLESLCCSPSPLTITFQLWCPLFLPQMLRLQIPIYQFVPSTWVLGNCQGILEAGVLEALVVEGPEEMGSSGSLSGGGGRA